MPRQTRTGPPAPGMTQNWLRYQPPGSTYSLSVLAKASRTPGSGRRTSASQPAGTTTRPCAMPSSTSICPNLARSRAVAEIPPSGMAVPSGSQVISASRSAPIGCQMRVGDEVGDPDAADPLAGPAEHVGVGRPVAELAAVRPAVAQRGQVRVGAGRVTGLGRAPAHGAFHDPDLGVRCGVRLAERDPGPHVEQVPDRGARVSRPADLGHVGRDRGLEVEQAPACQHPGRAAQDRLGHRHEQVPGAGGHAVVVPLGHDLAIVQDDEGVGVRVVKHVRDRRCTAVDPDRRWRGPGRAR